MFCFLKEMKPLPLPPPKKKKKQINKVGKGEFPKVKQVDFYKKKVALSTRARSHRTKRSLLKKRQFRTQLWDSKEIKNSSEGRQTGRRQTRTKKTKEGGQQEHPTRNENETETKSERPFA